jgi:hypothetical protein
MSRRRQTIVVSIVGVLAVALYAGFAALQILVLNPLAAAPGRSLDQIRTDLSNVGESLGAEVVVFVLGIGVVIAVVVAVVAIAGAARPTLTALLFLAVLSVGAFGYFAASFTAGMGLADTYGISGADYSPWARPLYLVSAASLIAAIVLGVSMTRASRLPGPAPIS